METAASTVDVGCRSKITPWLNPCGSQAVTASKPRKTRRERVDLASHPSRRHSRMLSTTYAATVPLTIHRSGDPLRNVSTAASARRMCSRTARTGAPIRQPGDPIAPTRRGSSAPGSRSPDSRTVALTGVHDWRAAAENQNHTPSPHQPSRPTTATAKTSRRMRSQNLRKSPMLNVNALSKERWIMSFVRSDRSTAPGSEVVEPPAGPAWPGLTAPGAGIGPNRSAALR